jgi:hypothetical protein
MFRCLTCAVLALSALVPSPARAEITHYRIQGATASATFYERTSCLDTYTDLSVAEIKGSDEASLTISVAEYEFCKGIYRSAFYASVSIPADGFRITGHLSTVSLQLTVQGQGRTGAPESMALDLTWTGKGEVYTGRSTTWGYWGTSVRTMVRSSGTSRDAVLSGSLILESRNLADTEEAYGTLELSREGSKTIVHPNKD